MLENGVRHIRDLLDPELKVILSQYFVGNVKCDFLMFETIRFRIQNYLINSKKKTVMMGPHLPLIQYRHLIPAIIAWADRAQYTTARPIAT